MEDCLDHPSIDGMGSNPSVVSSLDEVAADAVHSRAYSSSHTSSVRAKQCKTHLQLTQDLVLKL